jgi:hypothetical protein
MKTLLTTTLLAAGLSLSTASYSAAVDFIDNVHYTTDTISGLDWLDVTQTVNMSWNDVNSQLNAGGALEGWNFATGTQFLTMINNFAGTSFSTTPSSRYDYLVEGVADQLVRLLGNTLNSFHVHYNNNSSYALDNTVGHTLGWLAETDGGYARRAMIFDNDEKFANRLDYVNANIQYNALTYKEYHIGAYLVRATQYTAPNLSAVPIPAAAFLFAPALLGFLGLRHKRRA